MDDNNPFSIKNQNKVDFLNSVDGAGATPTGAESWIAPPIENHGGGGKKSTTPNAESTWVRVPQTNPESKVYREVTPKENPELFKHRPPTEAHKKAQKAEDARRIEVSRFRLSELQVNTQLQQLRPGQLEQSSESINDRLKSARTDQERVRLKILQRTINRLKSITDLPDVERQNMISEQFKYIADTQALRLKDAVASAGSELIDVDVKRLLTHLSNGSLSLAKSSYPESYQRQVAEREKTMSRSQIIQERLQNMTPSQINITHDKLSDERVTDTDDVLISLLDSLSKLKVVGSSEQDANRLFRRLNWLKEEEAPDVRNRIEFRFGDSEVAKALTLLVDEAEVQRKAFLEQKSQIKRPEQKEQASATQSNTLKDAASRGGLNESSAGARSSAPPAESIDIVDQDGPLRELLTASPNELANAFSPKLREQFLGHMLKEVDMAIEQVRRISERDGKPVKLGRHSMANLVGGINGAYQRAYYARTGELLTPQQIGIMPVKEYLRKVFDYDLLKDSDRAEELNQTTNMLWTSPTAP